MAITISPLGLSGTETNYAFQQLIESGDNANDDQFGRSISVSGNTFASGAPTEDANGANAGAVYVFTTADNGTTYTQQQKIVSSASDDTTYADDHFGRCVDLDGDTLAISAPRDKTTTHNTTNTGSVEIWNRTNTTWSFTTKLIAPSAGDQFAGGNESISLSGDYLAVAHKMVDDDSSTIPRGATRVYKKTNSTWSLHQTVRPSTTLFNSTSGSSQFSETVCLKGKWLVSSFQTYSTPSISGTGRAIVYKRNDSTGLYEQDAILAPTADVADQQFSYALDITNVDGDTPRIALTSRDTPRHTIYIFERSSSGSWSIIKNIDNIIDPTADDNSYGAIVRISGDNVVIGNQGFDTDSGVTNAGRAFHYEYNSDTTTWTQRQIFNGDLTIANANYGFAMDVSDDGKNYVMITSPGKPQGDGTQKGFVRAYADRPTSGSIVRDTQFSQTIAAVGDLGEVINSVVVSGTNIDSGITISGDVISGKYVEAFNDKVHYVSKGSSDLLETPEVVVGAGNVPPNKDIIKFETDSTSFVTKTYTATVTYNTSTTQSFTFTHQVNNDFDGLITFLTNYLNG